MKKEDYERAKVLGRAYYESHECKKGECVHVATTSVMTEKSFHSSDITYCHAGLNTHHIRDMELDSPIVATIDLVPGLLEDKKVVVSYFHWLFNHSPFSGVFMNTSAKSAFDYGIVCRATECGSLLVSGLMATRLATESNNKGRLELWWKLVSMGCDKSLAFVVVSYAEVHGGVSVCSGDNHTVFGCVYSNKEAVLGFIKGEPNKGKSLEKLVGYSGISHVWERGRDGTGMCHLLENIKTASYVIKDTPFGKKRFDVNTADNWCEQAIGISEEFIK